mmetsp:Transcript_8372/g.15667  ORF Transcript_8372/g.15667 Transcript_8372/m.15667 type:complete len:541 (+) Transcript_8372:41-1663(+)
MAFSNPRSLDAALRPGRLACAGEWSGKGKTMKITQEGDQLLLNMGQGSPTLIVAPTTKNTEEVWPMQWAAMREPSEPALYILELPTPTSSRLYVKKPGDDRIVEFVRGGGVCTPPVAPSDGRVQSSTNNLRPPPILTTGTQRSRSRPSLVTAQPRSRSPRPRGRAGPQDQGRWRRPSGGPVTRGESNRDMSASEQAIREEMVTFIKRGQRESPAFKERWAAFCDRFGRGFYDPARHNTRFLEDFTHSERKGGHRSCSRRSSRSLSRRPARASSPPPRRSQSRSRSVCRRRRRCIRRGPSRMRRRRSLRGPRRGARRCHRNRSTSGMPSRQAARRGANAALADAERHLARVRDAAVPETAEALRKAEEKRQTEIIRAVELERSDAEENLRARLIEAEAKLQHEKAERMREAEHKLDKAIASRLREAEERLRRDVDARVEEVRRSTEESTRTALEDAERRAQAEASAKVKEAEERVQKARARAASFRDSNEKHSGSECESGGTSSSSYSGSASPCHEGTTGGGGSGGGGGPGRGGAYERPWN